MLAESHPLLRTLLRFLALPYCYCRLVNWKECPRSPLGVAHDLLYIFFRLHYFPDNYSPCRLWEVQRDRWAEYYGSSYHPYQRRQLRRLVQRHDYQILFNDKVVCEQLCRGMGVRMPRSLGLLETASDYRARLATLFEETCEDRLMVKPVLGHAGMGISLALRTPMGIVVRSRERSCPLEVFVLEEDCVVQELVQQDARVAAISSSSVNTIRVVTLQTLAGEILVVSSTMRFSVGESFVDNWSAGGIAVGVDLAAGTLKRFAYDKHGNRHTRHPLSGVQFEGFAVPAWDAILAMARVVQEACPFYRLIGMDIALTREGEPVLIEVNANPDLVFQEQTSGPLLSDDRVLRAFGEYGLLINNSQRRLLERLS